MEAGRAIITDALAASETRPSRMDIYDRDIGVRLLHQDPDSGAEHYLIRYPAGLRKQRHRHTASQTIVVLKGRLSVNGRIVGPGGYCHLASGGKKFLYVFLMCDSEVAQEPPLRTYWLHMNLPLYSPSAPGSVLNPGYGEYELWVHSQTSPYICLRPRPFLAVASG